MADGVNLVLSDTSLRPCDSSGANDNSVKKEVMPLSEWIVGLDDVEKGSGDILSGSSGTVEVLKDQMGRPLLALLVTTKSSSGENLIVCLGWIILVL